VNDKWWSVLFGTVMFACAALFVVAPIVGWWLPMAVSNHAEQIDNLFYIILGVTGFFFILTEALLVYFMYRYTPSEPGAVRSHSVFWSFIQPLTGFFNTASKVEMAWTIVPAVILLYLAFAQVNTWVEVKYRSRLDKMWGFGPDMPVQVDISARQFEWRVRYPSVATWRAWKEDPTKAVAWVKTPNFDDVRIPNELHIIKNRHCVVQLSTLDVIHSFNSAHMRVKQDALPGKIIPVWFKPIESNVVRARDQDNQLIKDKDGHYIWQDGLGRDLDTGKPNHPEYVWDIACAELCGWGHYRMVGKIFVHPDEDDFLAWLESAAVRQHSVGTPPASKSPEQK
jgi:cytochrome c oxidase subunit II